MIERLWRGVTSTDNAGQYIAHLENDTFPKLQALTGYINSKVLKRNLANGNIEYLIVTCWESIEDIAAFSGNDIEIAVVPEAVQSLLLSYDKSVVHYEIYKEYQ